MSVINDAKLQTRLNNCIRGLMCLQIKCLDTVISLDISYEFQCKICDYVYEGKIGNVNARGCPNKHKSMHKTRRKQKREQKQLLNQQKQQARKNKRRIRKQQVRKNKQLQKPLVDQQKRQGLERRQKHMHTYMQDVREKNKLKQREYLDLFEPGMTHEGMPPEYDDTHEEMPPEYDDTHEGMPHDDTHEGMPPEYDDTHEGVLPDDTHEVRQLYMNELKDKNIRCVNHTNTGLGMWWYCDICEDTWQEQFESLIVKLDTITRPPCTHCMLWQKYDDDLKPSEIDRYMSELKENRIECLNAMAIDGIKYSNSVSIDDNNIWRCLNCYDIWENNFNNILHPYDGCTNCKRIDTAQELDDDNAALKSDWIELEDLD